MTSSQPFIEHIYVNAEWSGDPSSPLTVQISLDIVANSRSHLALIRNDHPSVLSAHVASIPRASCQNEALFPITSPAHDPPGQSEAFSAPKTLSNGLFAADQHIGGRMVHEKGLVNKLCDVDARRKAHNIQTKDTTHSVTQTSQKPLAEAAEAAEATLFSQTASLFEDSGGRDVVLSPPPPPASEKLTIPKRISLEPDFFHTSDQQSPTVQRLSRKDDSSPPPIRRRPVSLDKRPPWRPLGAEYSTQRGRKQLGTDLAKRRISRSVGTLQMNRGQTRQRQASLPGRMRRRERGLQKVPGAAQHNDSQTLASGSLTRRAVRKGLRDRDSTVKVTRYAEALNASERLEKWLQDRRHEWPAANSSTSEIATDDDRSVRLLNLNDSSGPALSPSPTPSSCVALPWTSVRGIRGGGSIDGMYNDPVEEAPIPALVEDNGTLFAFFQGCTGDSRTARFRIQIDASIKLEAQHSGCHSLEIPGLPMQSGSAKGTFVLKIIATVLPRRDNFQAYEKVAYVENDFSTHPLHQDQMSHVFRLDTPFSVKLLCFEACRALQPSDFEVDSDVHTRYDWENLDGDGITAEHSMVCSIRLHPFLLWAETVEFKLYLTGGPSGTLESSLEPGNRRIYLCGKGCGSEHELEITLSCPVADLHKTFTISWEQPLGTVPFEVWLPRISGLYRQKLDEVFDLPREAGTTLIPRPCKRSRLYSMIAQDTFLKSSAETFFFPENQHTPGTIQKSLTERSGQFYDELTAEDLESVSGSPVNEGRMTPLKNVTLALQPKKRPRIGQTDFLSNAVPYYGHSPICNAKPGEYGEILMPVGNAAKPTETASVKRGHHTSEQSFPIQLFNVLLRALRWFLRQLAAPARLLKALILLWLCFRAFDHGTVVQLEQSIALKSKQTWKGWDFEPVRLHGDITGWKHLVAKANQGAARVICDGHIGSLMSFGMQQEGEKEEREGQEAERASAVDEDVAVEERQKPEQPVFFQGELKRRSSPPVGRDKAPDESLTLLDRIDLALGWKPPTEMQSLKSRTAEWPGNQNSELQSLRR
jgi:hypothetical protein